MRFNLIKRVKALFNRPKTIEVFEFGGHIFRMVDAVSMPKIRQANYIMGEYEREWGITRENILMFSNEVIKETQFPKEWDSDKDLIKKLVDKLNDIRQLQESLFQTVQEDFQYAPFLKAANHIILIDDENPKKIEPKYYDLKMQMCKDHPEVLIFFCRAIRILHLNIQDTSSMRKAWEYYPAPHLQITENRFLNKIGKNIYSDMRMKKIQTSQEKQSTLQPKLQV